MRRLSLALIAAVSTIALTQIASAADLPRKAPAYMPPPPPPVYSWTGFYVGGHLGWGWGNKEWSNQCEVGGGCFFPSEVGSGNVDGFLGGLQVGYNYQIDRWVLGVEGDFSWADLSGSNPCFAAGDATCTNKADWFGTLTGRIGGTVDHALLYVKGGAAWVHDKYADNCLVCGPSIVSWTGSQTKSGWTVGAGVEYAFTRNWSGKVEYDYMDFGTKNVTLTAPGNGSETLDIQQRIHMVKAGVNYKFDWGR